MPACVRRTLMYTRDHFQKKGWNDFLTSAFVRQRRRETKNPWERLKINIVRTAYSVSVSECRSLSSMPLFECVRLSREMSRCQMIIALNAMSRSIYTSLFCCFVGTFDKPSGLNRCLITMHYW